MTPFSDPAVDAKFDSYFEPIRTALLNLRELIFDTARSSELVGPLTETLKWGQPSYLTAQTKSGTTIRIDALDTAPAGYAVFCHCQTTLIATIQAKFGALFRYEGQRAIYFTVSEPVPETELRECILLPREQTHHPGERIRDQSTPETTVCPM